MAGLPPSSWEFCHLSPTDRHSSSIFSPYEPRSGTVFFQGYTTLACVKWITKSLPLKLLLTLFFTSRLSASYLRKNFTIIIGGLGNYVTTPQRMKYIKHGVTYGLIKSVPRLLNQSITSSSCFRTNRSFDRNSCEYIVPHHFSFSNTE